MKSSIIILIVFIFSQPSKGQNKNEDTVEGNIIKNKILTMYQQVQSFDYNPRFVLDFSAWNCTYEVLVNDVQAMNSNEGGNVNGAVYPCSEYILNSGRQTITIRLFPEMKEGYIRDAFLTEKAGMKIKVQEGDFYKQKPKDYKTLYEFETPAINQDSLPFIEFKGVFEANVPRILEGWTNGVDLSKENKDQLLKEVVTKYEEFRQCFDKKDAEYLARLLYKRQLDFAKAYYENIPEKSKQSWQMFEDMVNPTIKTYPLEQYDLTFYGNGKIVALARQDMEYCRDAVVVRKKDNKRIGAATILLYRPKPGAPLEVIR